MNENKEPWEYGDKDQSPAQPETPDMEQPQTQEPEQPQAPAEEQPAADTAENGDAAQNQQESAPQASQAPADQQSQNPGQPYGQQSPYQNPGQPYGRQSPYQNPYNQPYGRQSPYQNPYNQPYGQQNPYQNPYNTYGNNYTNPYSRPAGEPYQNPYGSQPPRTPQKMSGGLKAFLCVLAAIAVGLLGTFIYFSVQPESLKNYDTSSSSSASSAPSASSPNNGNGNGGSSSSASSSASSVQVIPGVSGDGTDASFAGIEVVSKPSGSEMKASEVYKKVISSVVGVETNVYSNGQLSGTDEGTGIIATADGYILTNAHVVNYSRSSEVTVVMQDKKEYSAKVVGFDKTSDLAVLKINATGLSPATFGKEDDLEIGEQVLAIGNPGGLSFAGSLTGGYVSALDRSIASHSDNGMTYIQTDAAINPGNSGGPLVNLYGQVVGINSSKIVATGYEGMGFSIPLSKAQPIINQLIRSGYVSGRARLGITVQNVGTSTIFGTQAAGVAIVSIDSGSDMTRAGGKVGDIIVEADGQTITTRDDLSNVLAGHKPGDTISMKLYTAGSSGNGTTKEIQITLLEDKGETQQ